MTANIPHDQDCGCSSCFPRTPNTLTQVEPPTTPVRIYGPDDASKVAVLFDAALRRAVSRAEFREILRRNRIETTPGVCHSHDFTDANDCMAEALSVYGVALWGTDDQMTDAAVSLWNAAWEAWNKSKGGARYYRRRNDCARRVCPDCGEPNEQRGHQTCQYPQDDPEVRS